MCIQDFLKEVDIRFMDQLRRGASVVAADLARDPPPASLKEAYHLMCLTGPPNPPHTTPLCTPLLAFCRHPGLHHLQRSMFVLA